MSALHRREVVKSLLSNRGDTLVVTVTPTYSGCPATTVINLDIEKADAIVDFANTRGADKVMYAGYFPMGLSLDRIFAELPGVPFKAEVWPGFLRHNAVRVFDL